MNVLLLFLMDGLMSRFALSLSNESFKLLHSWLIKTLDMQGQINDSKDLMHFRLVDPSFKYH